MKTKAAGRVRVVQRGRGRELRIDGTFASWYQPGRATTGSVWDALAIPVLALPAVRRRRVLLLGLGGGSAARLVRALAPAAQIVGVELDREVVRAARRHFDLDALRLEIVHGDARDYLRQTRRRFDIILDDVFVGSGRRVRKPDWLPEPGLREAARKLAPAGVLASNAIDEAAEVAASLRQLFPALARIEVEDFDNRILVGGSRGLSGLALRRAASANPLLAHSLRELRFRSL